MEKNNTHFDDLIRDKLETLTPNVKAGSWDQLAQRLDAVEQNAAFDKIAADKLEGIQVPYQESSWQILAERLALERARIQAVVHYKLMEVSLVLLVLLTLWQHFPLPAVQQSAFPIATTVENNTEDAKLENKQTDYTNSIIATADDVAKMAVLSSDKNDTAKRTTKAIQQSKEHINPIASLDFYVHQHPHNKDQTTNKDAQAFNFDHTTVAHLEGLDLELLDYKNDKNWLKKVAAPERKTFLRVGFVGSTDYNRVITPTQKIDNGSVVSYDRYTLGYSGGLSLGVEHDRWEIETGAIYEARKYQAIPTLYVSGNVKSGYRGLSLRDFELNTVNIPLRFRYNIISSKKWKAYALAGVSLNVMLTANYYTADQSAFGLDASNSFQADDSGASNSKPEALQNQALNRGFLQGGGFFENTTPYGNLGLGLERSLSYKLGVFVQPTYQHAVPLFNEGLGPYQDRIHNFGINIGIKARL